MTEWRKWEFFYYIQEIKKKEKESLDELRNKTRGGSSSPSYSFSISPEKREMIERGSEFNVPKRRVKEIETKTEVTENK